MRIILSAAIAVLLAAGASAQVTTDRSQSRDRRRFVAHRSAADRRGATAGRRTGRCRRSGPRSPSHCATRADHPGGQEARADATLEAADTYQRDDLLAAGEGVFGKGAAGLAGLIEKILKEQGRPNAYIAGREAAGAFVVGLRYGSGVMTHKVEGQRPVYWTGPSVGFDVGGDANKVFTLVYNLYDTEELYHRFPAAEGRLYFVGGFAATYLRRGNIVLIPIRLGVGYRAGVNVGYMKFSHKAKWLPF